MGQKLAIYSSIIQPFARRQMIRFPNGFSKSPLHKQPQFKAGTVLLQGKGNRSLHTNGAYTNNTQYPKLGKLGVNLWMVVT